MHTVLSQCNLPCVSLNISSHISDPRILDVCLLPELTSWAGLTDQPQVHCSLHRHCMLAVAVANLLWTYETIPADIQALSEGQLAEL